MKKIITALILVFALCSCGKVTRGWWAWIGEKEIPGNKLYEVTGELNKISITFEPNTTPYIRTVQINLASQRHSDDSGFRVTQAAQ